MQVAIVSAYCKEPLSTIWRCVSSIANQEFSCTHVVVADGYSRPEIDGWAVQHIKLPTCHGDFGSTPRLIGAASAYSQGFDALCWLDADNWFEPDHISSLLTLAEHTGASIVTATRNLRRPDGTLLGRCTESDGERFSDTNCYLLKREAMALSVAWGFQNRQLAAIGDRVLWAAVRKHYPHRAHNPKPTVNYTTLWASHYVDRKEPPPPGAKLLVSSGSAWSVQCTPVNVGTSGVQRNSTLPAGG